MDTWNMRARAALGSQYQDGSKLDIRKTFHKKYATNPQNYGDWILSRMQFFAGCRVLEVGCGTGDLWAGHPSLVDSFSGLVLTDISTGMTGIASGKFKGRKNIQVLALDVLEMPFPAGSFDIVLANSMLYHLGDVDLALANIRRVLREGGLFSATTFGKNGQLGYITRALYELGLSDSADADDISFSLENGREQLQAHFSQVRLERFDNHLEVTEPGDLVEYIFSMASMSHLDRSNRQRLVDHFETCKDSRGVITIPMEYGMFISRK